MQLLWRKGQKRQAREEKARLAETFVSVRDATIAAAPKRNRSPLPWYLRPDRSEQAGGKTGAELDAEIDRLALQFPGRVKDVVN